MAYDYDGFGNLEHKSNTGYYAYDDPARPHRLTGLYADANHDNLLQGFQYDAHGNVIQDGQRSIQYASFDKPTQITAGANAVIMSYGIDRTLIHRTQSSSGGNTTTLIAGGIEKISSPTGSTRYRIPLGSLMLDGQGGFELLHRDHQGSVVSVSNAAGALVSQSVYDPFGQQTVLWSAPTAAPNDRGYTGHRNLANVGIIHMGGRIYDPRLGRFLQADPFVQFPHASQGHNRYSYVQNNPLSHTDPSGYFLKKLGGWIKKWWRPVLGIAITVATAGKALSLGGVQGLLLASGSGAVAGAVATGSLRGAATGALAAAAFYGIGSAFEAANCSGCFKAGKLKDTAKAVKTALHATTGGLMNVLNGGQFGHGFVAAGIIQSFADPISGFDNAPERVVAAAIVGGTASEITGGKFANGAVTGAFSRAFNDELHMKANARLPKPIRALARFFGIETPGYSLRLAASFPGVEDAKWNFGISVERDAILSDASLGQATVEVGYNWKSGNVALPNPARGAEVDLTLSPPVPVGAVYQYDSAGTISGLGISVGRGLGTSLTQPEAVYNWQLFD